MIFERLQLEAFVAGKSIGTIGLVGIGNEKYLREDAAAAFEKMLEKSEAEGVKLVVDDAFRRMDEQERLYAKHQSGLLRTPVAKPGWSKHQSGVALDIAVHRTNTSLEYRWLAQNAPQFGWHNTGASFHPPEFWHWEFIAHQEKTP